MALSSATPKTYAPSSRSRFRDPSGQSSAEPANNALPSGTDFGTAASPASPNSAPVASNDATQCSNNASRGGAVTVLHDASIGHAGRVWPGPRSPVSG